MQEEQEFPIWVGDLSPDVDNHLLYRFFASRYSTIRNAKVVLDDLLQSRGFGFVKFISKLEQQHAVDNLNGQNGLGKNPIKICLARPKTNHREENFPQMAATELINERMSPVEERQVSLDCAQPMVTSLHSVKADRVRLCGAARKRYRALVAANVSAEEARAICHKTWSELRLNPDQNKFQQGQNVLKHKSSALELHNESAKKSSKVTTNVGTPNHNVGQTSSSLRVGIRNKVLMSEDQMKMVHRSLILSIKDINEKGRGPKFLGLSQKAGWILVTCADRQSQLWLVDKVQNIQPWPGAELSIISDSELPKPIVANTFIPKGEVESIEEALHILRIQNDGLNTEHWRILHKGQENESGYFVTFSIDEPSADKLRASHGKATMGFKRVFFKIKGNHQAFDDLTSEPLINRQYW